MAITTPNLSLQVPVVGDTSPSYTTSITSSLNTLDLHDHSSGKGVAVKANTLTWAGQVVDVGAAQLQSLATARFSDQAAANTLPAASYPRGLFTVAGDLFYNTGYGAQMQLTQAGVLNGALVGGIAGSYASSGASITYNSTTKQYTLLDQVGVAAALAAGAITAPTVVAALTSSSGIVAIPAQTKTYRINPCRGMWPSGNGVTPNFAAPALRPTFSASSGAQWCVPLPTPAAGTLTAVRILYSASGTGVAGTTLVVQNSSTTASTVNSSAQAWPSAPTGIFTLTIPLSVTVAGTHFTVAMACSSGSGAATVSLVGVEFDVTVSQLPDAAG